MCYRVSCDRATRPDFVCHWVSCHRTEGLDLVYHMVNCDRYAQVCPGVTHEVLRATGNRKQEIFICPKDNKTEYSTQKPYNILHICRT